MIIILQLTSVLDFIRLSETKSTTAYEDMRDECKSLNQKKVPTIFFKEIIYYNSEKKLYCTLKIQCNSQ